MSGGEAMPKMTFIKIVDMQFYGQLENILAGILVFSLPAIGR